MMFEVGQTYREKFCVSAKTYNGFIRIFRDKNLLHTNEEFAMRKGFKSVVMHGNILNGFLSYFVGECLPTKNVIIHTQEIQFKNPVYLNDILNFSAQVVGFFESVNVVEFKFQFTKQSQSIDNHRIIGGGGVCNLLSWLKEKFK
jgi:acyl dehydratase